MDFDFKKSEEKWRKFWEKEKIYKFNPKSKNKIYSIDTAPPTVSGRMHIGHACSYAQQDFIVRYKRMKGYNIFYPFGTDDNGLPTERLVEKVRNVKAKDMSREAFIKLCFEFLKEELPKFRQDWKDMGMSCDWDISYSTIDAHSRRISQWSFLDLHKKGRMYRKDAPAMWCPECRTGVAQVEVQDKEIDSMFNDIIFKMANGENVTIATTRPELLPACVAVFYNPQDSRYKKLKGKKAQVPLFNFSVPVMEDKRVDMKKGTGIVMCCTFGDQTDMEWQKAYNLPIKIAISSDGKMTDVAGKYRDLSIKEARKKIIEDLKNENLLVGQKPIKHFVNVHERCGTEIEFVKSKQWFVKYLDLKKDLLKWGRELKWHPDFMRHRYENWVNGLQWDWLVSNQRYFGVPIPVWYCEKCDEAIFAKEKQLPVNPLSDKPPVSKCQKCGSKTIIPEKDVLNTWFTSSMSPQLSTWLMPKDIQGKLFPMSLRGHAHEIITFWLFNTLLKSRLHFGKNPWSDAMISGYVTLEGEKMSKSKGNIINPQDVMGKYGSDAIRYWAASAKLGMDFDYQEKEVITGKKFITKLLNASNFIFMNLRDYKPKKTELLETDRIFLGKLNELMENSTKSFENYEYYKARFELDNFFWKIFCDNYLEIVKKRIYNGSEKERESACFALYTILLSLLKMFAPITPFITEEIYQNYFKKNEKEKSIHVSQWPEKLEIISKKDDEKRLNLLLGIISQVRQEKTKANKPMNAEIILHLEPDRKKILGKMIDDLKNVTNSLEIRDGDFRVEFN
ncbi:MAG TPA: valine--tRNA ligase [Candidatus Omnitrophota bacterium]|nr:valine--tRNA ligase [Candidatus Omnitrophota bacterium]